MSWAPSLISAEPSGGTRWTSERLVESKKSMTSRRMPMGVQRSEVRGQRSEVRGQRSEVRGRNIALFYAGGERVASVRRSWVCAVRWADGVFALKGIILTDREQWMDGHSHASGRP